MDDHTAHQVFISYIEQNKGIIYKIAKSFNRDEEDEKDLVQEIIFQLWRAFPRFEPQYKFSTWMYRIALNVAISSYRKERRAQKSVIPITDGMISFALEDDTSQDDNLNRLYQFIHELRELDRALILLYLEERSGKEIAEITGLSEANVRTKINRVKEQLKAKFSNNQ